MGRVIKKSINNTGNISISLIDKKEKPSVEYNYLVDHSVNNTSTCKSKNFTDVDDAEEYYQSLIDESYMQIIDS